MANTKVTTGVIKDDAVGADQLASNAVVTDSIADNSITTAKINNSAVLTAKISDSAVTNAKLSSNSVDSDQYVDGSIDTAHIADGQITSAKLDTNIAISGELTLGSHLNMGDNDILKIGASADLQIYHDGSNSYIKDTGTGRLTLQSATDFLIANTANTQNYIYAQESGYVRLYYAGATKLATTSSGIDVTGVITTDGILKDTASSLNYISGGTASNAGANILLYGQSHSSLANTTLFRAGGSEVMRLTSTGLGIGTTSPIYLLSLQDNNGADLGFSNSSTLSDGDYLGRIYGTDSSNTFYTGINMFYHDSNDGEMRFRIKTAGTNTDVMTLVDGSVGIGTTSPSAGLHVETDVNPVLKLDRGSANNTNANLYYNGTLTGQLSAANAEFQISAAGSSTPTTFFTNGSERMRIDSSGSLLVNTTSAGTNRLKIVGDASRYGILSENLSGYGAFNLKSTTVAQTWSIGAVDNSSNSDLFIYGGSSAGTKLTLDSSGNVGIGSAPVAAEGVFLQTGNNTISQRGFGTNIYYDGSNYRAINTGGSTLIQGGDNHIFYTAASASAGATQTVVERMRIDSSGNLLVGTTVSSYGTVDGIVINHSGANVQALTTNSASSSSHYIGRFYSGSSEIGSIYYNGSATAYNTSSDARLKDVTGEARGLEVINKLKPVAYNWKESGQADEGLIAQEVLDVVPNAVTGSEEEMYSMDYSKLVVHLVAGMKEQQTQIDLLKQEIQELKG